MVGSAKMDPILFIIKQSAKSVGQYSHHPAVYKKNTHSVYE
jgi:hypothetical protein